MEQPEKSKSSLPIYENWLAYLNGAPCQGYSEYEILSDAIIIGSSEKGAYGPYEFINIVPPRHYRVRPAFILRVDNRLIFDHHGKLDKTDTTLYHGGGLTDEIAAILSLTMGVRFKAGDLTREFSASDDRFGNPIGYYTAPVPEIVPDQFGIYRLRSMLRESRITALEPFKYFPMMDRENVVALIKAARLYQQALWIAESDPSLAWVMMVSALETAANHWKGKADSPTERLRFSQPELFKFLEALNIPQLSETVAMHISGSLGSGKKFTDFVMTFLPPPPEKRPLKYLQLSWEEKDMRKTMRVIYDHRSKALHGGTPFPSSMCNAPYATKDEGLAEVPLGLSSYSKGGAWTKEDAPILLNTFEYLTRKCLLNWWKSCDPLTGDSAQTVPMKAES